MLTVTLNGPKICYVCIRGKSLLYIFWRKQSRHFLFFLCPGQKPFCPLWGITIIKKNLFRIFWKEAFADFLVIELLKIYLIDRKVAIFVNRKSAKSLHSTVHTVHTALYSIPPRRSTITRICPPKYREWQSLETTIPSSNTKTKSDNTSNTRGREKEKEFWSHNTYKKNNAEFFRFFI